MPNIDVVRWGGRDRLSNIETALNSLTASGNGQETLNTVASSTAAFTVDLANGSVQDITLTANCTITLTGTVTGSSCSVTLLLRQDGTGSRTVTWPGSVSWLGGSAPTLQTAASALDVVTLFTVNNGTTWYGYKSTSASSATTFHGTKVWSSAVQSIANSTATAVTFDSEEFDTDAYHSTVSNTSRITIPSGMDGKYMLQFSSFWNASPGTAHAWFKKNGTTDLRGSVTMSATAAVYTGQAVVVTSLVATDYVEVFVTQNSGGAVNLGHASVLDAMSTLSATFLGS